MPKAVGIGEECADDSPVCFENIVPDLLCASMLVPAFSPYCVSKSRLHKGQSSERLVSPETCGINRSAYHAQCSAFSFNALCRLRNAQPEALEYMHMHTGARMTLSPLSRELNQIRKLTKLSDESARRQIGSACSAAEHDVLDCGGRQVVSTY